MKFELSDNERSALQGLLMHEGWNVLTQKLWPHVLNVQANMCAGVPDDFRFHQGIYLGIQTVIAWAEKSAKNPTAEMSLPLPTEADLAARSYRRAH